MKGFGLGAAFFAFVLTAVAGGRLCLPAAHRAAPDRGSRRSGGQEHWRRASCSRTCSRSIGENFPAAKNEKNPYRVRLAIGGIPVAVSIADFLRHQMRERVVFRGPGGNRCAVLPRRPFAHAAADDLRPGLGFLLPDRVLDSRVRARAQRLRSAIPAALDLMVLAMEAGQSLDQSLADVSRGLKRTHPDLSAEFAQLYLELRTGSTRADSFRHLGARNKEPELRKLANLLIDSDRYGASIGPALRSHAKYLRTRFRQQAQERARKVGVKLIFPVFFLIFPSVLLVTLGPACMMMYQQLGNMLK